LPVATRRRHRAQQERLLIVDESLSTKLAHRLRERGRDARSSAELSYGGFKDPPLLRALFSEFPQAVLITADDNMPMNHPLVIREVAATIATIEPWERRHRPPLVLQPGWSSEEAWKREVVQRWAHAMAVQEAEAIRRYSRERSGTWTLRIKNPQRRLFSP
jgi:hypothetical protein